MLLVCFNFENESTRHGERMKTRERPKRGKHLATRTERVMRCRIPVSSGVDLSFPLLSPVARCQTMLFGRRVRPAGDGASAARLSPCAPSLSEESTSTREDCRTEETGGNALNPANGDGGAARAEPGYGVDAGFRPNSGRGASYGA